MTKEASKNIIWFKAKKYGYGWNPSSWQGWLVIFIYMILVLIGAWYFNAQLGAQSRFIIWFLLYVFILSAILVFISYKKGEKARWRWGDERTESKEQRTQERNVRMRKC